MAVSLSSYYPGQDYLSEPKQRAEETKKRLVAELNSQQDKNKVRDQLIELWLNGTLELWRDLRLAKEVAKDALPYNPKAQLLLQKVEEEEENQLMRRC